VGKRHSYPLAAQLKSSVPPQQFSKARIKEERENKDLWFFQLILSVIAFQFVLEQVKKIPKGNDQNY
jgi:hypothetical protein